MSECARPSTQLVAQELRLSMKLVVRQTYSFFAVVLWYLLHDVHARHFLRHNNFSLTSCPL